MIKSTPLGEVSKFIRGITFKPDNLCENYAIDSVVCMRTKNVQTNLETADLISVPSSFVRRKEQRLQTGDLLVSSANSWNLVGKACWVPELDFDTTAGGFISILRCDRNSVDPRFFYHWVTSGETQHDLRNCGRQTTNISNLDFDRARALQIPIPHKNGKPDLDEQKRIAAILDKADAIRRKRQQALRLTDDFLRSVFLDMFGDPVTNPKRWDVLPISSGIESFDGGKNVSPIEFPRKDGIRVLKVSAVTSGEFLENQSKSFSEDFQIPSDYIVRKGDLLISRANTSELIGAVAYVWVTSGRVMLPDKLWRFVWSEPQSIHPLFMLHMAHSNYFRHQLILRATGSSGSMKNIGKAKMLQIPIPMPPFDLQQQFANIAIRLQDQIQNTTNAIAESEALFSSLQQRAFRGEL